MERDIIDIMADELYEEMGTERFSLATHAERMSAVVRVMSRYAAESFTARHAAVEAWRDRIVGECRFNARAAGLVRAIYAHPSHA